MSTQHYSIALIPNPAIVAYVKDLKVQLGTAIGWFSSRHSMAHITIGELAVSHEALQHIHTVMGHISNDITPFEVSLTDLASFTHSAESHTLYLKVDELAAQRIKGIMEVFHQRFTLLGSTTYPHVTVGRKLTAAQLAKGRQLLTPQPKTFIMDSVSLRRFNPELKQYEIIHTYPFRH